MGNSRETEVVFSGALGEGEEEVGGVVVLHKLPGLVNDEEATLFLGADNVPDVGEDDIHGDGAKLVFEVANVKDNHVVVDVDVALLGEDTCEGAGGVFAQALSEGGAGAFHMKKGVV